MARRYPSFCCCSCGAQLVSARVKRIFGRYENIAPGHAGQYFEGRGRVT